MHLQVLPRQAQLAGAFSCLRTKQVYERTRYRAIERYTRCSLEGACWRALSPPKDALSNGLGLFTRTTGSGPAQRKHNNAFPAGWARNRATKGSVGLFEVKERTAPNLVWPASQKPVVPPTPSTRKD